MVLSDHDIKLSLKSGKLKIKPAPDLKTQLGSNSLDLRLGNKFRVFEHSKHAYLDPYNPKMALEVTREVVVKGSDKFIVQAGDFVLATTIEHVEIPDDLAGRLEGRSSLGRLGIVIHSTAGSIDSGWKGTITLEIANLGKMPVALTPGMRICSLAFEELSSPADIPYYKKKSAKYVNQKGPDESRIYKEK